MTDAPKTVTLPLGDWRIPVGRIDRHTLYLASMPYATVYKLMGDPSWLIYGDTRRISYSTVDAAKAALEAAVLAMGVEPLPEKPKSPWTRVQDGLPDVGAPVLITVDRDGRYTERAFWSSGYGGFKWISRVSGREIPDERVIAWMPEPTPYEGD